MVRKCGSKGPWVLVSCSVWKFKTEWFQKMKYILFAQRTQHRTLREINVSP